MKSYIFVIFTTVVYLVAGSLLINVFTIPVDIKENNTLGHALAFLWGFVVYFVYTFPHLAKLREDDLAEKTKDMKDTHDDEA